MCSFIFPWQETSADAGDGDGGGETILDPFSTKKRFSKFECFKMFEKIPKYKYVHIYRK